MKDAAPLSRLPLALLGLSSLAPQSGYGLKKFFESTPMGHFSASPGAIYPALERLESEGLLEGALERSRTLRPRKRYTLTEKGRRALRDTLLLPVTREDVVWRLDELALRFSFMGHLVSRAQSLDFLRAYLKETESYARELQAQAKAFRPGFAPHGRLAVELGLEQYLGSVRWARRALKEIQALKARHDSPGDAS